MKLTEAPSSINSNTAMDCSDQVIKRKEETQTLSNNDSEIGWKSRLHYQLHVGSAYKIRTFSSRGAFLVLILNFLISAGYGVPAGNGNAYHFYEAPHSNRHGQYYPDEPPWQIRDTVPVLCWFPAVLVLGLLGDIRYGRKTMVLFGVILLWLVVIADCVRITVFYHTHDFPHKLELFHTIFVIDAVLSYVATAAFLVNSVQLAIDQLADASAKQVSSLIQWYTFTYFLGVWVFNLINEGPLYNCFQVEHTTLKVVINLLKVVFVSIALCLVAICSGWIRTVPITDNPPKLIWQVLRFAAKHKYPVNRSALTYWEDEIPSRINLGKDKYGGPFTNEQVEDVKTFFRMITLTIPVIATATSCFLVDNTFVYSISQNWTSNSLMDFNFYKVSVMDNSCIQSLYASFLANINLWICLYVLCSEFILYPLAGRCIPSMLKRIGLAFFLQIPESITMLILNIIGWSSQSVTIHRVPVCCVVAAIAGLQFYLVISSFLEFISAQSPQRMKGFLIGFMWLVTILLVVVSYFIYYLMNINCTWQGCGTGYYIFVTLLGITGFIFYCMVTRWYKHRERDDCPNNQAIIEEVFARRIANEIKCEIENSVS